jgi:hypothetical protein
MDVLQAAAAVVRDLEPEERLHAGIERARQIRDGEVAGDHRLREVVAEHDVGCPEPRQPVQSAAWRRKDVMREPDADLKERSQRSEF